MAGETPELAAVDVVGLDVGQGAEGGIEGALDSAVAELDDVLVGDDLAGAGADDGSALLDGLGSGGREGSGHKGQESSGGEVHLGRRAKRRRVETEEEESVESLDEVGTS